MELNIHIGELITFTMIAIALGMDALSLGIGIGARRINRLQIIKLSLSVGAFHVLMPLVGIIAGNFMLKYISHIANLIGGGVLLILGANMLWSAIIGNESRIDYTSGVGLIILSLGVSVDALSVGFSLGLFLGNLWLIVLLFGFMGGLMTAIGLTIGTKLGEWLGKYGEAMGGVILIIFGIKFLV